MKCPHNEKLALYIEGDLSPIESAIIRDHLIHCDGCRLRLRQFQGVEESLSQPPMRIPPPIIEKSVMRRLFPILPTYGSVFAFLAVSFFLLVTWIYVYFDFANNSLIQAMQVTSHRLFRFFGGILQGISTVFSGAYTGFKALSKLLSAVVNVQIHGEILLLLLLVMTFAPAYLAYRMLTPRRRKSQQSRAI